jgi:hypothetical protein
MLVGFCKKSRTDCGQSVVPVYGGYSAVRITSAVDLSALKVNLRARIQRPRAGVVARHVTLGKRKHLIAARPDNIVDRMLHGRYVRTFSPSGC